MRTVHVSICQDDDTAVPQVLNTFSLQYRSQPMYPHVLAQVKSHDCIIHSHQDLR